MIALSASQQTALVQMFTVGMERAANALRDMVDAEVALTVPRLEFLPAGNLQQQLFSTAVTQICGVTQHFQGPFHTEAKLIFDRANSLDIVRMVMDESCAEDELAELEAEAMAELGNVLLYACIGSIGNLTKSKFVATLPEVRFGSGAELLQGHSASESVLFLYIDFSIAARTIKGYMVFLMEPASIDQLIAKIDQFIAASPSSTTTQANSHG